MKIELYVFVGGGIGSLFRYLITKYVSNAYEGHFPLATSLINLMGCFLIGLIMGLLLKNEPQNMPIKALFVTGFCGGFTTFSTFSLENITLIQKGEMAIMLIYTGLSVFLGLLFTYLGLGLGGKI